MSLVDLRSDTLTRPTDGMRAAMAAAPVGDDVYGEDPTVNALEEEVAALFGHQAAVLVPSGTMGNQIALRLLVPPAEELICHTEDHIVTYEHGGLGQHGGIQTRTLDGPHGWLEPAALAVALRPPGWGTVATRAVSVEQTHNRGGGTVYPFAQLAELRSLTAQRGVALHCDGARIWNAAVATGTPLEAYGRLFDTLSVCLSKGLGAPVGSLVVTDAPRAAEARVLRKRLGGGMRQAGILAAGGRYALAHHVGRLAEDHARAATLAEALGVGPVQTNIVSIPLRRAATEVAAAAKGQGVLVSVVAADRIRCVVHLDIDDDAVSRAVAVLSPLLAP